MKRLFSKVILFFFASLMILLFQNATLLTSDSTADNDKMIFGVGVHLKYYLPQASTGLTDSAEKAKEDLYFKRIKGAGFNSFRTDYTWAGTEPVLGQYRTMMDGTEQFVQRAPQQNLSPLVILGNGNAKYGGGYPVTPEQIEGFTNYAKYVASHLRDTVSYYEIWNEWLMGTGLPLDQRDVSYVKDPKYYANVIKATVKAVKAVNPKAITMAGSQGLGDFDYEWYKGLAEQGAFDDIDGVSFHPYNFGGRKILDPNINTIKQLDKMHAMLLSVSKRKSLDFYFTEIGWPDYVQSVKNWDDTYFDDPYELTEQDTANRMARFLLLAKTRSYIKGIWIFSLSNVCMASYDKECHFGLIDHNPGKWKVTEYWKKAYVNVMNISDLMTDYRVIDSAVSDDGSAAIVFQGPKGYALTMWRMEDGRLENSSDWKKVPEGFTQKGALAVLNVDEKGARYIPSDALSSMPLVIRSKGILTIPESFKKKNYKIVIEKNQPYTLPEQNYAVLNLSSTGDLSLAIDGETKWNSRTTCSYCAAGIKDNGNIFIYDKKTGKEYFSTGAHNRPSAKLMASREEPYLRIVDSGGIAWASSFKFENFSLKKGQSVRVGASGAAPDLVLTMRTDGKLALTLNNGKLVWSSEVECADCWMLMQGGQRGDGNLVLRSGDEPKWSTDSWGHKGAVLEFSKTSPHMKIVDATGIVWSISDEFVDLKLTSQQSVNIGISARSPDVSLKLEGDGNLIVTRYGKTLWSSETSGACTDCRAVMQGDGNFALYNNQTGKPYFDTRTWGLRNRGAKLKISYRQPYLQIKDEKGVLWGSTMSFDDFRLNPSQILQIGPNAKAPLMTLKNELSGELVLYNGSAGEILWRSNTECESTHFCYVTMHGNGGDGNLVSNAQPKNKGTPYAAFSTGTYDENKRYKRGTLVKFSTREPAMSIVDDTGIIWASSKKFADFTLWPGQRIKVGSGNAPDVSLYLEKNGNVVLYKNRRGAVLWESGTTGRCENCRLSLQGDGNLVLYDGAKAVFDSKTWGHPGAYLEISASFPYLRIVSREDKVVWTSSK
ncbi:hypothetical protein CIK05_05295 [Bdellovibrio sp. qaytius]|nr:hypothetical protein CIK05_05295 [Bdellovibrio sp. qaytius]